MGKWGKYLKKYNPNWEKEPKLKAWLGPSSETDVLNGKPEAWCKLCMVNIRAHHSDLITHANHQKHKDKEAALDRKKQQDLNQHGYIQVTNPMKLADLQLAAFVGVHCSVKTIDHLGEILRVIGKGSPLQNLRLHRTKCAALIEQVIAPVYQEELIKDIGDSDYALIVDEVTDVATTKFMGVCVRYFSKSKQSMISDFLGIIQVTSCSGESLAASLLQYLETIKLPLKQFYSVGTDGASAMVGVDNSFYVHLRKSVPHLVLIQCICHSLHKCAEYACKKLPDAVSNLMTDTYNYFCHSSKMWDAYAAYYKERNPEKKLLKLQSLSKTRWLIWLPVSSGILDQWTVLKGFFNREALASDNTKAQSLAKLYNDNANLLYLTFLRTILRDVQRTNLAFESENPDVTKVYADLRNLVFSTARRVLYPQAIPDTSRPGALRVDAVTALKDAFQFKINKLPVDRMNFGDSFKLLIKTVKLDEQQIVSVHTKCSEFLFELCEQLFNRVPRNLPAINKVRHLTPRMALAKRGRATFDQLPPDMKGSPEERDELESQWNSLGELTLPDVCPHSELNENIDELDIVHFWACVMLVKNGAGQRSFSLLAERALRVLTLPISNATIERIFSLLAHIKGKRRNRLQLDLLDALLRLRVHLKVDGKCCTGFTATKEMLCRFNSSMYDTVNEPESTSSSEKVQKTTAEEAAGGSGKNAEDGVETEPESNQLEPEDYDRLAVLFEPEDDMANVAHFVTVTSD